MNNSTPSFEIHSYSDPCPYAEHWIRFLLSLSLDFKFPKASTWSISAYDLCLCSVEEQPANLYSKKSNLDDWSTSWNLVPEKSIILRIVPCIVPCIVPHIPLWYLKLVANLVISQNDSFAILGDLFNTYRTNSCMATEQITSICHILQLTKYMCMHASCHSRGSTKTSENHQDSLMQDSLWPINAQHSVNTRTMTLAGKRRLWFADFVVLALENLPRPCFFGFP